MSNRFGYSLSQLRILWEIALDGLRWSNIMGTSSTDKPIYGDFSVYNTKTDIVEQVWRSGIPDDGIAWIMFDCGLPETGSSATKAIMIDTFALLNHNLTPKAEISVWGYGDSNIGSATRSVIKSQGTLIIDAENPNIDHLNFVWVMPEADFDANANKKFRHWLVEIKDPNNSSEINGQTYIQVGRIVGGSATVFTTEENMTANFSYQEVSYKDEVKINGFTSINNVRALKKKIRAQFKNLNGITPSGNYYNLNRYMRYCRDSLKALVILDSRDPYLFYAYAKLSETPNQDCNYLDDEALYISFDLEWDEAK